MLINLRKNWLGYSVALGGVALVTILYRAIITDVNATTVALSFLLVVLTVASMYSLGPAIVGSVMAMLCFNFFFLPPVGTLTIQDPQNWVALFAFLITAVTASQLSAAARARADEAEKRRAEVWKLYQLSRAIIATPDSETATASIARQVVEVFDLAYCAVFLPAANRWQRVAIAGNDSTSIAQAEIEETFRSGEVKLSPSTSGLTFKAGELTIDTDERRVTMSGAEIKLTPKEFEVLKYLARNSGKVVTHRALLQAVWGSEAMEQTEYLRVFINQLRRKIEPDPQNPRYIITEPWVGYRFNPGS